MQQWAHDPLLLLYMTSSRRTLPDRILKWPHIGSDDAPIHVYIMQRWDTILQDTLSALKQ